MKKYYLLFLLISYNLIYSQNFFGNIPDLVFRNNIVKTPIESDTLEGHLMNFHFIKDTLKSPFLFNTNTKLQGLSMFYIGNRLGGENKILLGKVGSANITSTGVYDYGDSLSINTQIAKPKIITYSKNDKTKSPYIFLSPINEENFLVPDMLVFSRNLSSNEKQRVETYLSIKYGISINYLSEKNYLSSEGHAIWNFKDNKKYGYRVTGIGRDDVFQLYQKQSSNIDHGLVTFALGEKKVLNENNEESLDNLNFLLWGDNNEELIFPIEDLLSTSPKGNMLRNWKIQIKSGAGLNTSVYFNLKNSDITTNLPKLKIFRSTEDFQNNIAELYTGTRENDSIVAYKNITWDLDNNGTDYFTLNNAQNSADISIVSTCAELQNGTVKINIPLQLNATTYSLLDINSNIIVEDYQQFSTNQITFNNLSSSKYQITIHRINNLPDIVKTFDMEGISNVNVEDNYLWQGEPIELDVNYENYQYTLVKPNGTNIVNPPFLLDGLGEYTLKVKNKLGCEIQKQLKVLNQEDYANQNNVSLFKEIKLYPNPSHDGVITVKVQLKSPRPITIQIYNSLGKLLKQAHYSNTADVISTLTIPAVVGYYNVKIFIPEESKGYNLLIN